MLKKLFNFKNALLGLCLTVSCITTCAQPYAWAGQLDGATIYDIVTDDVGNVYISGSFNDTVDFDPGPGVANLTSVPDALYPGFGSGDIFMAKYDAKGKYLWAKGMGGSDMDGNWPVRMALDKNGNIYLAGNIYSDDIDFDPGPGVAIDTHFNSRAFLAKYDNN